MSIILKENSPAYEQCLKEWILVIWEQQAIEENIRPLRIWILNLMPNVFDTEFRILRLLANSPMQIEITWIKLSSAQTTWRSWSYHLTKFYKPFNQIKWKKDLDGLIITWVNKWFVEFEEVTFWDEMTEIMNWAKKNIKSILFYCWASHAGLFHYFWIPRIRLHEKCFWVFEHNILNDPSHPLVLNMDDNVNIPQSRWNTIKREDIEKFWQWELQILIESIKSWIHLVANRTWSLIFMQWHPEYWRYDLKNEYWRDLSNYSEQLKIHATRQAEVIKKLKIEGPLFAAEEFTEPREITIPLNYFPDNNPDKKPILSWRNFWQVFYWNWVKLLHDMVKMENGNQ